MQPLIQCLHQFYSRESAQGAFGPTQFLFIFWLARESAELLSTGQHDAHELFISALNGVHNALASSSLVSLLPSSSLSADDRPAALPRFAYEERFANGLSHELLEESHSFGLDRSSNNSHSKMCPCAVHRTFSGIMQSDVRCERCGRKNSTLDPFLDLSLDLQNEKKEEASGKKGMKKKIEPPKIVDENGVQEEQDLMECLRR